jgi:anti-anti-sigma factor
VVTVFRCDVRRSRDAVVVAPAGELDLSTVDVVERELDELRDAGFADIVVDLRGLEFIDSTGLALLIRWHRQALHDLEFSVIAGPLAVQRVLELCGLQDTLRFISAKQLM